MRRELLSFVSYDLRELLSFVSYDLTSAAAISADGE